jgi:hypothetical protein
MFFTWNTINQQKEEEEEDTDNYNTKKNKEIKRRERAVKTCKELSFHLSIHTQ